MPKKKVIKNIPTFNINVPGGGPQKIVTNIDPNIPIYSSFTGKLIGYGGLPRGTISDAPPGNKNYGKPYRVIEYNPCNDSFMAHTVITMIVAKITDLTINS
jgi:hypothetical protein